MGERLVVEIGDPDVDLEIVEGALDLLRGLRQYRQRDLRMALSPINVDY